MWPEFVRKITILLLYDRINAKHYRPKYWKPGNWFLAADSKKDPSDPLFRANYSRLSTAKLLSKPNLFKEESEIVKPVEDSNNLLDIDQLMSQNIDIDSFKPYDYSDFGSFNYVIRSRNFREKKLSKDTFDADEHMIKFKTNRINLNAAANTKSNQLKSISFNLKDNVDLSNNFFAKSTKPTQRIKNNFLSQLNSSNDEGLNQLEDDTHGMHVSQEFEYSKVTDDIYKTFGRPRHSKFTYPQQITVLKNKPKHAQQEKATNKEEFLFPDFIESSTFSKSILTSKNFFEPSNGSLMNINKNEAAAVASVNKYSNLINANHSRLDSHSIAGGTASNMSSAGNFHGNRNAKLLKILGEF